MLSGFLAAWDATSSFFLFPEVRDSLAGGDTVQASWILTITGVVGSALLLLSGRLGERFGYKTLYQTGLLMFATTSLLSGLAPNLWSLVVCRGLAAASVAVIAPSSLSIIAATARPGTEARAVALFGFCTGIAGIAGPITMTVLVSTASWRYGYLILVPLAIAVAAISRTSAEAPGRNERRQIPIADAAVSALAIGLVVLALSNSDKWGWMSAKFLSSSGIGVILLIMVTRRSSTVPDPFVPLDLFRHRRYRYANSVSLVMNIAFYVQWLAMLLYLTEVWGLGLIESGLLMSLPAAVMALVAVPAGRIVGRVGHFPVILGGAVVYTAGFGQFWLVAGDNRSNLILLVALGGAGVGMGTVYPTTMSAAVFGMRTDRLGSGSAVVNATNRVGGAFGVALLAALVANETGTTTSSQHLQAVSIMPIVGLVVIALSFGLRGQSGPSSSSTPMQCNQRERTTNSPDRCAGLDQTRGGVAY